MDILLGCLFLLSGFSALLFETLWFRSAALMLGSSIVAGSIVLASFMGGLALGNALASRHGARIRRPVAGYAMLELVVGLSGSALVILFPALTPAIAALVRDSAPAPLVLNAGRLALAFSLMLVPATAMGATLPLLVRALCAGGQEFGWSLGRLYAWNTLGGVAGALAGDAFLVETLGMRGTGLLAGAIDCLAAVVALVCVRALAIPAAPQAEAVRRPLPAAARVLLVAAFGAGAILLAFEVVWFRLLQLWTPGTNVAFALMLAVVLAGIAAGGALAGLWSRRDAQAHRHAALVALAAGAAAAVSYSLFADLVRGFGSAMALAPWPVLRAASRLMLPACLLSGVLFPLLGKALHDAFPAAETRTTGLLTLANTLGAMAGALVGGFVLLPRIGVEASIFALAAAYAGVALCVFAGLGSLRRPGLKLVFGAALAFGALLASFPFGLMKNQFLKSVVARWAPEGSRLVAVREGMAETILYLRKDVLGEPVFFRMVTNAFSMAASTSMGERYMRTFVWWPLALHPEAKRALLISFGVGSSAKALVDSSGLSHIDIVDISRDVLAMNREVFQSVRKCPLDDPRVEVHIEDGRFFLLSTAKRFDLITAEPPPPKNAQVVNLYSRQYFHLVYDRLAEGGVATYWLPVALLAPQDARAIVGGFCEAFEDCSLWSGAGPEWMLAGTRGARGPVSEDAFTRQWRDPVVGAALRATGIEEPEQLGALFIGDAPFLRQLTAGSPPLDDDYPYRLSAGIPDVVDVPYFRGVSDTRAAAERFAASAFVTAHWPEALRARTLGRFETQEIIDRHAWKQFGTETTLQDVHSLLTRTPLRTPVLWLMGSSEAEQRAAERGARRQGAEDPGLARILAASAMADRDYARAASLLAAAQPHDTFPEVVAQRRVLALALAGDRSGAAAAMREAVAQGLVKQPRTWAWLAQTFTLEAPAATASR